MDRKTEQMIKKYSLGEANFFHIRNRNEIRVIKALARILSEHKDYQPETLDMEDIFALALNKLPARYVQHGTIVLNEPVAEDAVSDAVREAINQVMNRPSYTP